MPTRRLVFAFRIAVLCSSFALASCGESVVGPPEHPADTNPIAYTDLAVGTGAALVAGQSATIEFAMTLVNGHPVDPLLLGGTPLQFVTGEGHVLSGLDLGVRGMRVGGHRLLSIPPSYGYGTDGAWGFVPPNSILLVDVRLIEVAEWP